MLFEADYHQHIHQFVCYVYLSSHRETNVERNAIGPIHEPCSLSECNATMGDYGGHDCAATFILISYKATFTNINFEVVLHNH